jgi:hypothetical protein
MRAHAKLWLWLSVLVACLMLMAQPAAADVTARVEGTVTDATGAIVPNVSLTLRNSETGMVRTITTDALGFYQFIAIPVGTRSFPARRQVCSSPGMPVFPKLLRPFNTATWLRGLELRTRQVPRRGSWARSWADLERRASALDLESSTPHMRKSRTSLSSAIHPLRYTIQARCQPISNSPMSGVKGRTQVSASPTSPPFPALQ